MAMTKRERAGKIQIMKKLGQEGYPTYADLLSLFELNLTKDPDVVGYMLPDKGIITVNEFLDIDQVSTVIRHEILHEFLEHKKRYDSMGIKGIKGRDDVFNIAADYEISNLGYTDKDKKIARGLKIGDRVVSGLVTDIDHPDWVDKTFEQIYDLLREQSPESLKDPKIGNRGNSQIQQIEAAGRRAQQIKDRAEKEEQKADSELVEMDGGDWEDVGSFDSGQNSDSGSSDGKKRNKYDDEAYQKMSPEEKRKERARRRKEAAKQLKEEADKLIKDLHDVMDEAEGDPPEDRSKDPKRDSSSSSGEDEVFDTPEEQKERADRIAKIREVLSDLSKATSAKIEASQAIIKEKAAKAEKNLTRYRQSALTRFTESLNKFIRDAIARSRNQSWSHINKKYVNSGLLKPGYSNSSKGNVPSINVYFDRSGSWDSNKTKQGLQAISTLNKYVTRGEIVMKLYYFNTRVMDTDPGGNGGTNGEPILQHILQTKPNNVIILTDDDINDCRTQVTVPGAVWFLFYDTDDNQITEYLRGKKLTKIFRVE